MPACSSIAPARFSPGGLSINDSLTGLRAVFEDYLSAKDAATEKALVDALTEIENTYNDQTRDRIDGLAEQVKSIFNQEQLAVLSDRFGTRRR